MTDLEKVQKGLDLCLSGESSACNDCPYDAECKEAVGIGPSPLRRDALKLLKELPDVVQCGECKHYKDGFCYNPNTYDDVITCGNTSPDWSCADGKRR